MDGLASNFTGAGGGWSLKKIPESLGWQQLSFVRKFSVLSLLWIMICGLVGTEILSRYVVAQMASKEARLTSGFVRAMVAMHVGVAAFRAPHELERDFGQMAAMLHQGAEARDFVRMKVFDTSGTIIWSDEPRWIGKRFARIAPLRHALAGEVAWNLRVPKDAEHIYEQGLGQVFEVFTPIFRPGSKELIGVVETYKAAGGLFADIARVKRFVWLLTLGGGTFIFLSMLFIVKRVSSELVRTRTELEEEFLGSLHAMARLIEMKDPYTAGHAERTTVLSLAVAKRMGLKKQELVNLKAAASLHDVGKIGVPGKILGAPRKLLPAEIAEVQRHPVRGAESAKDIGRLREASAIIRHHHEWYDGQGYPDGLQGAEIPLGARIVGVVDAYDAMTSERPYRKALSHEEAVGKIIRGKGTQFDPWVVDSFLEVMAEWQPGQALPRVRRSIA